MLIYDIYVFVDSKFVATNWKDATHGYGILLGITSL